MISLFIRINIINIKTSFSNKTFMNDHSFWSPRYFNELSFKKHSLSFIFLCLLPTLCSFLVASFMIPILKFLTTRQSVFLYHAAQGEDVVHVNWTHCCHELTCFQLLVLECYSPTNSVPIKG